MAPRNTPQVLPFSPIPYAIGQQSPACLPWTYSLRLSARVHALPGCPLCVSLELCLDLSRCPGKPRLQLSSFFTLNRVVSVLLSPSLSVIPLLHLRQCPEPSILFRVKSEALTAPHFPSELTLCLAHSALATPASLLFLKHSGHAPTLGPLPLLAAPSTWNALPPDVSMAHASLRVLLEPPLLSLPCTSR